MFDNENQEFVVLVNAEGQYSIWPTSKPTPDGWNDANHRGEKASCLEFIEREWVDMRPISLRKQMADA